MRRLRRNQRREYERETRVQRAIATIDKTPKSKTYGSFNNAVFWFLISATVTLFLAKVYLTYFDNSKEWMKYDSFLQSYNEIIEKYDFEYNKDILKIISPKENEYSLIQYSTQERRTLIAINKVKDDYIGLIAAISGNNKIDLSFKENMILATSIAKNITPAKSKKFLEKHGFFDRDIITKSVSCRDKDGTYTLIPVKDNYIYSIDIWDNK